MSTPSNAPLPAAVPPEVVIVIVNWNGWKDTIECLESVFRLRYPCFTVVVCDNHSTDGSVGRIQAWADGRLDAFRGSVPDGDGAPLVRPVPYLELTGTEVETMAPGADPTPLVLIRTGANLGFAGANNVAMRWALRYRPPRYFWLLNNDAVVDADALAALVEQAEREPRVGMVGSRLLEYHRPQVVQTLGGGRLIRWQGLTRFIRRGAPDGSRWDHPLEPDYVTGSSLLARADAVRQIGLMEEGYFLYSEEVDWCLRARRRGWRMAYCPGSRVWHKEGASFERLTPLQNYCGVRSSLVLTRTFYPALLPLAFAYSLYRCMLPKVVRRRWADLVAVLWAYRDFVTGSPRYLERLTGRAAAARAAAAEPVPRPAEGRA
jgi:GT2 family glycosyltransferase